MPRIVAKSQSTPPSRSGGPCRYLLTNIRNNTALVLAIVISNNLLDQGDPEQIGPCTFHTCLYRPTDDRQTHLCSSFNKITSHCVGMDSENKCSPFTHLSLKSSSTQSTDNTSTLCPILNLKDLICGLKSLLFSIYSNNSVISHRKAHGMPQWIKPQAWSSSTVLLGINQSQSG